MRALAGLAVVLSACTPSFESASQVTDLRVLAIAADPAEAFVDLQAGTVQPVRVRILVADPSPRGPVVVKASLCFPTDDRICEQPRLDLPEVMADKPGEVFFDVAPTAQLAQLIVGALQDDRLKGLGGIRVQLTATVDDGDPNGPVRASKVLLFSTQPAERRNTSPRIESLRVIRGDGRIETYQQDQPLNLERGEEVGVLPLLAPGAEGNQTYTTTDLQGREVTLTEQAVFNFFTEAGAEWDRERAFDPLPTAPEPTFGIARFRPYRNAAAGFWIVARDGRGGESWFAGQWGSN